MCGCVLIGKAGDFYEELGFEDGVNFISYDGTLTDLVDKITFYQENTIILENIANNSYEFVKKNFNEYEVSSNFINKIQATISQKFH